MHFAAGGAARVELPAVADGADGELGDGGAVGLGHDGAFAFADLERTTRREVVGGQHGGAPHGGGSQS